MSAIRIRLAVSILTGVLLASLAGVAPADAQTTQGVKVHGLWVIDVRQPDGTLVQRREFRNGLIVPAPDVQGVNHGAALLASIAAGQFRPTSWTVFLGSGQPSAPGICSGSERLLVSSPTGESVLTNQGQGACLVSQQTGGIVQFGVGPGGTTFTIGGMVTATGNATIRQVLTTATGQDSPNRLYFSGTQLPEPITVGVGQIVQFSVTFTFS